MNVTDRAEIVSSICFEKKLYATFCIIYEPNHTLAEVAIYTMFVYFELYFWASEAINIFFMN